MHRCIQPPLLPELRFVCFAENLAHHWSRLDRLILCLLQALCQSVSFIVASAEGLLSTNGSKVVIEARTVRRAHGTKYLLYSEFFISHYLISLFTVNVYVNINALQSRMCHRPPGVAAGLISADRVRGWTSLQWGRETATIRFVYGDYLCGVSSATVRKKSKLIYLLLCSY